MIPNGLGAIGMLTAFIGRVEAQSGAGIDAAVAGALIAAAEALIAELE